MPTTSNFGWTTPADTDLVKDGAAAIRTLGNGIDTSLVDLKGGTTGQVLSKASNTDLDFTWSSVDPLTILDAKGDLISATAADTPARLASSGVNGDILTVDTSTATGLKWAAPVAAGGYTLIAEQTASASTAIDFTSISSSYKELILVWSGIYHDANSREFEIRFNNDSNSNYNYQTMAFYGDDSSTNPLFQYTNSRTTLGSGNDLQIWGMSTTAQFLNKACKGFVRIYNANSTTKLKTFEAQTMFERTSNSYQVAGFYRGVYNSTSAISQINIVRISASGTFTNMTNTSIQLWGLA